jgi:hypothetical protein
VTIPRPSLSEAAERLLSEEVEHLRPDVGAGAGQLPALLLEPVLRRILSFLESPAGAPTLEDVQRVGGYVEDLGSNFDELRCGAGMPEELSRLFFELVEQHAVLSFTLGGVPLLGTGIQLDADRLATRLEQARSANTVTEEVQHEEAQGQVRAEGAQQLRMFQE